MNAECCRQTISVSQINFGKTKFLVELLR